MLWHSRSELEAEGPPTKNEMFWVIAVTPLLIAQIASMIRRIVVGFQGDPFQISIFIPIEVTRSGSSWPFAAVIALYAVLIVFLTILLWACALQLQRWAFWRRHSK
jgi:hypothetical protein